MVVDTNPAVELPPLTPLTCQVTAVFVLPLTVAVRGWVARVAKVAVLGEIETLTCAPAYSGSKTDNEAITTNETNAVAFEIVVVEKDKFVIVFSFVSTLVSPYGPNCAKTSRAVTAVRSQSQCAVVVQLLMTSPSCRVAHPFHFNLCFEFQALPFSSLRQHELCLSNFAGERISRVEAAALQLLPIMAFDCHAQHT